MTKPLAIPSLSAPDPNLSSAFLTGDGTRCYGIVVSAKPYAFSPLAANPALNLRPSAFAAKPLSIFGNGRSLMQKFAAFWARPPSNLIVTSMLVVVNYAKSISKIRSITLAARSWWKVNAHMLGSAFAKLKILYSVISPYVVLVVNYFTFGKKSAKVGFHNQSMLSHPSTIIAIRVLWSSKQYVSVAPPDLSQHLTTLTAHQWFVK